jgi:hypothetical protein
MNCCETTAETTRKTTTTNSIHRRIRVEKMIELNITERGLKAELKPIDFINYKQLRSETTLSGIIANSLRIANEGFADVKLVKTKIKNKHAYRMEDLAHDLVVRRINSCLRSIYKCKQSNRNETIKCLKTVLKETAEYNLHRYDIKKFYETIDRDKLFCWIRSNNEVPYQLIYLIEKLFQGFASYEITGIPRGIGLSATLSEIYMKNFDTDINSLDGIYYYSRFVDDIIIVTGTTLRRKKIKKTVLNLLPKPLKVNGSKQVYIEHNGLSTNTKKPRNRPRMANTNVISKNVDTFDYLGYRFNLIKPSTQAKGGGLWLDISTSKIRKLKTRVCICFLEFIRTKNFNILEKRLKLLTSNYVVYDHNLKTKRLAGFYYNYSEIDLEYNVSLKGLDNFLKHLILGKKGKICQKLAPHLSSLQRKILLRLSFYQGYRKKIFFHFPSTEIVSIMQCWSF